ncbi:MAG: cytidine deaminase [Calditrichia bacterium]
MDELDFEIVDMARDLIRKRFKEGRHHIASVLRTKSGNIFSGVHVEVYVGRMTVCGEAVAIGAAATAGGMCREMIADYSPAANVIILSEGKPMKIRVSELLPHKYEQ